LPTRLPSSCGKYTTSPAGRHNTEPPTAVVKPNPLLLSTCRMEQHECTTHNQTWGM
jgi:hypothetical protein